MATWRNSHIGLKAGYAPSVPMFPSDDIQDKVSPYQSVIAPIEAKDTGITSRGYPPSEAITAVTATNNPVRSSVRDAG